MGFKGGFFLPSIDKLCHVFYAAHTNSFERNRYQVYEKHVSFPWLLNDIMLNVISIKIILQVKLGSRHLVIAAGRNARWGALQRWAALRRGINANRVELRLQCQTRKNPIELRRCIYKPLTFSLVVPFV